MTRAKDRFDVFGHCVLPLSVPGPSGNYMASLNRDGVRRVDWEGRDCGGILGIPESPGSDVGLLVDRNVVDEHLRAVFR